jgi:hypothetical protein
MIPRVKGGLWTLGLTDTRHGYEQTGWLGLIKLGCFGTEVNDRRHDTQDNDTQHSGFQHDFKKIQHSL